MDKLSKNKLNVLRRERIDVVKQYIQHEIDYKEAISKKNSLDKQIEEIKRS